MINTMNVMEIFEQVEKSGIGFETGYVFEKNINVFPVGNPEFSARLCPIAKNKAGSLIAVWLRDNSIPIYNQPVVWLDSEGSPNAVIANDIAEYLSVIPFGSGLVYDVISYLIFLNSYPELYPDHESYLNELSQSAVACKENGCADYMELLSQWKIDVSEEPVVLIRRAFNSSVNFKNFILNK